MQKPQLPVIAGTIGIERIAAKKEGHNDRVAVKVYANDSDGQAVIMDGGSIFGSEDKVPGLAHGATGRLEFMARTGRNGNEQREPVTFTDDDTVSEFKPDQAAGWLVADERPTAGNTMLRVGLMLETDKPIETIGTTFNQSMREQVMALEMYTPVVVDYATDANGYREVIGVTPVEDGQE